MRRPAAPRGARPAAAPVRPVAGRPVVALRGVEPVKARPGPPEAAAAVLERWPEGQQVRSLGPAAAPREGRRAAWAAATGAPAPSVEAASVAPRVPPAAEATTSPAAGGRCAPTPTRSAGARVWKRTGHVFDAACPARPVVLAGCATVVAVSPSVLTAALGCVSLEAKPAWLEESASSTVRALHVAARVRSAAKTAQGVPGFIGALSPAPRACGSRPH